MTASDQTTVRPPTPRRAAPWLLLAGLVLGYAAAAAALVWLSRDQLNPDAVSYIRLARHYAAGQFALAVNSYWGPMLSWLLAPAAASGANEQIAAKVINAAAGLALAGGAAALLGCVRRRHAIDGPTLLVIAGALLIALARLPDVITPDLLLAAGVVWLLAAGAALVNRPTLGRALAFGALAAVCYLTKSYALYWSFIPAGLVVAFCAARRETRRALPRSLLAAALAWVVLAGPWIVALSVHEGRLTAGDTGRVGERIIRSFRAHGDYRAIHRLRRPCPGRVNAWEDPGCIPPASITPAEPPAEPLAYRWAVVRDLTPKTVDFLRQADPLGLLWAGMLASAVMLGLPGPRRRERLWLVLATASYPLGYLLIHVEPRHLWPMLSPALVLAVASFSPGRASSPKAPPAAGRWRRRLNWPLAALLCVSLIWEVARTFDRWQPGRPEPARAAAARALAGQIAPTEFVVADDWPLGLAVSHYTGRGFLGQAPTTDPAALAAQLAALTQPGERVTILLTADPAAAARLAGDERFERVQCRDGTATVLTYNRTSYSTSQPQQSR